MTLYTTHCPKCKVIKMKLDAAHLNYTEVDDVNKMMELGIQSAPILEVGSERYDFMGALGYIRSLEAAK